MTTAILPEAARSGPTGFGRLGKPARHQGLWRAAAALAGAALAATLFFEAPGSVKLVRYGPGSGGSPASALPGWTRPCLNDPSVDVEGPRLAFCARADGRVVGSITNANGETHLLLTGGFHLTLVQLRRGAHTPSWGSRIIAIGPLGRADGLRELQAISLVGP